MNHIDSPSPETLPPLTFDPRLPHRGMGVFLTFMSAFGLLIVFIGIMSFSERRGPDDFTPCFFLAFGIVATLVFLISGLFLATRRCRVDFFASGIRCTRGWCLWRRTFFCPHDQYAGLTRDSKEIGSMDKTNVAATVAGGVLGAFLGGFAVSHKVQTFHFLRLKHASEPGKDLILLCDPSENTLQQTMQQLAQQFGFNILDRTLTGYEIRASPDSAAPVPPAAHSFQPPPIAATEIPPTPRGIEFDSIEGGTIILIPNGFASTLPFFLLGIPSLAIGILSAIVLRQDADASAWLGFAVAIVIGVSLLLAALHISQKKWRLQINSDGLALTGWGASKKSRRIAWNRIASVNVARSSSRQTALLFATTSRDQWWFAGFRRSHITWICDVIRFYAQQYRQANTPDGSSVESS